MERAGGTLEGKMAWKDLISGSFGFGTALFAAYPADLDFASQAVGAAAI